jgi:hypothetical protein
MNQEDIVIKLTEHHEEIGSLKHRMKDCEESQSEFRALIRSVDRLALNMENMLQEQKQQGKRLERLEQSPSEDYKYYKRLAVGCIITGIIGAILGAVFAIII